MTDLPKIPLRRGILNSDEYEAGCYGTLGLDCVEMRLDVDGDDSAQRLYRGAGHVGHNLEKKLELTCYDREYLFSQKGGLGGERNVTFFALDLLAREWDPIPPTTSLL